MLLYLPGSDQPLHLGYCQLHERQLEGFWWAAGSDDLAGQLSLLLLVDLAALCCPCMR